MKLYPKERKKELGLEFYCLYSELRVKHRIEDKAPEGS